jgi:hypothetical protein
LTGYIMVRLAEETAAYDGDNLHELARTLDPDPGSKPGSESLLGFLQRTPKLKAARVVQPASLERLRGWEEESLSSDFPVKHSATVYWLLDVRRYDEIEEIRDQLGQVVEVELAYHYTWVSSASAAGGGGCTNYLTKQGYLDPAPAGIDAHWAWSNWKAKGQKVCVIDIESGWNLQHGDLPDFGANPKPKFGDNAGEHGHPDEAEHGTCTLGVIGAIDDGCGITGIAPELESLDVCSHYVRESPLDQGIMEEQRFLNIAQAIHAAITLLEAGDVLVLEAQRDGPNMQHMPVEIDALDADAIRLACSRDIIVVEAAGNGHSDLAKWEDACGNHTLDPSKTGEYFESGAILVGACRSAVEGSPPGHARSAWSNYGARVDCHAWGQGVWTTSGSVGQNNLYTDTFSATSSATAIIAGACAVVQSWHREQNGGVPLTPVEMRKVMSDPALGTPQTTQYIPPRHIGVMPDLRKIMP